MLDDDVHNYHTQERSSSLLGKFSKLFRFSGAEVFDAKLGLVKKLSEKNLEVV